MQGFPIIFCLKFSISVTLVHIPVHGIYTMDHKFMVRDSDNNDCQDHYSIFIEKEV